MIFLFFFFKGSILPIRILVSVEEVKHRYTNEFLINCVVNTNILYHAYTFIESGVRSIRKGCFTADKSVIKPQQNSKAGEIHFTKKV